MSAETDVVDLRSAQPPIVEVGVPAADAPPVPSRPSARRRAGYVLLAVAAVVLLFLLFEFVLSGLIYQRSQQTLLVRFRSLANEGPASTLEWVPAEGDPMAVLAIPRVGLEAVVVEGTRSSQTTSGPGHFRGSPLPGRPGNAVIMGRRSTFGAPFRQLDRLQEGDRIVVATGVGAFTYLVESVGRVAPGEPDVITSYGDTRLTLVTSDPPLAASGRLVVVAKPASAPAADPPRPPVLVAPSETGLTGESAGVGGLLLWGQLLVLTALAGIWLARGVSRRVAWILAGPTVAALAWALFLAANRFLPATL